MYKKRLGDRVFDVALIVICGGVAIVAFYPFIYIIMVSLSSLTTVGKVLIVPRGFYIESYRILFTELEAGRPLMISIFRSAVGPAGTLAVIYLGAYALAQKKLIFRKFFAIFVVFSMYFTAGLLPVYVNISQLGLIGSPWVYILPLLVSSFSLILIRTFMQELPDSLAESALIDGANDFQIAVRVILPVCLPVLAAVTLFQFVHQWNSYEDTLLYNAHQPKYFTLQYVLASYVDRMTAYTPEDAQRKAHYATMPYESLRMAMTVLLCIPVAVVYPFLQKYFVKGLLIGSIKG